MSEKWKMVPVEPTDEMRRAARFYDGELPITAASCYRAMIAAAPAPPVEQEKARTEVVSHEFQDRDGKWCPFNNQKHYDDTIADGSWPIRPLYALPPDAEATIAKLTQERDALHQIVCHSIAALRNGSCATEDCSIEFLRDVPDEIRHEVDRLTKQNSAYKTLTESLDSRIATHQAKADECAEAVRTLDSEREANLQLSAELNTFRNAVEHVTEDGKTRRSFSTSEGWAMVHSERLTDLECAEERLAANEKQGGNTYQSVGEAFDTAMKGVQP